jgi:hypothetical protein
LKSKVQLHETWQMSSRRLTGLVAKPLLAQPTLNEYHGANMADQPLIKRNKDKKIYPPSILVAIFGYTLVWFYSYLHLIFGQNTIPRQTGIRTMIAYYMIYFIPFVIGYLVYIQICRYLLDRYIRSEQTRNAINMIVLTTVIIQYITCLWVRIEVNIFLMMYITTPIFVDILLQYVWRLWHKKRIEVTID